MDGKKGFMKKVEKFLAGKGFYIVLFACVAVIGASAWVLLSTGSTGNGTIAEVGLSGAAPRSGVSSAPVPSTAVPSEKSAVAEADEPVDTVIEPVDDEPDTVEVFEDGGDAAGSIDDLTFIWPVGGAIENPFSVEALAYSKTMADWRTHNGVDLAAELGTRVMAAADGTVKDVYYDDMYGTTVIIDHGGGLMSVYANLAGTPTVSGGDTVTMSSVIGAVGDSALAEAVEIPHLHFAMTLDGEPVDPEDYLPQK